jgi:hypothetical protein
VPFYPDTSTVKVTGNPGVARLISGSPVAIHPCTAVPKSRHPDKSWFQFHRLPVSKDPFPVFIPVPFDPDKTLLVRRSPESPDMDACGVPVTWYPDIIRMWRGGLKIRRCWNKSLLFVNTVFWRGRLWRSSVSPHDHDAQEDGCAQTYTAGFNCLSHRHSP